MNRLTPAPHPVHRPDDRPHDRPAAPAEQPGRADQPTRRSRLRQGKWLTLGLWVVLAMLVFPLAGKLAGVERNDATTWLPTSAETTRAVQRAEGAFPGSDQLIAVVVYENPAGITGADRAKVDA